MTWTRWAGTTSILLGLAVVGCQKKASTAQGPSYPAPVPPTAETRQRVSRMASDALVGQVIAVMPDSRLVAVGNIPVAKLRKGDILMFLGGDDTSIGAGTIVNVVSDTLHVRYEEPAIGGRPPAVGDLAVHFSR